MQNYPNNISYYPPTQVYDPNNIPPISTYKNTATMQQAPIPQNHTGYPMAYPANYYLQQPQTYQTPNMQTVQMSQTPIANQAMQPVVQTTPSSNSSGVNITIYNPTVTPNGYVTNANNYINGGYPQAPNVATQQPINSTTPQAPQVNKKANEKPYKKDIVQLTDEYIKSLENYLNHPDPKIRTMGAKQLVQRFQEESSRRNDIALTNLLNKALQDPDNNVRFLALSVINEGKAQGDDFTGQILNQIMQNKTSYGLDAELAASASLKRAGNVVSVPTDEPPAWLKNQALKPPTQLPS